MSKVLVAMSGGVDSSVTAALLRDRGYECIGCTMKLFDGAGGDDPGEKSCCTAEDAEFARSVAYSSEMPYYVFNFKDDFKKTVIKDFGDNYLHGRTPNPCIVCNREMKFGKLFRMGAELGCDYMATGHYARVVNENGRFVLKKAADRTKDQSYVLYFLTQEQLARVLFPLGELTKTQVRAIAEEKRFRNAKKPDSQDICFVPDGDYAGFLSRVLPVAPPPGDFVNADGDVLGTHGGIINYTIGQRKGLGISAAAPLYVKRIDAERNRVVLGWADEMFDSVCILSDVNWIPGDVPTEPVRCAVRIRYHHKEQPAAVFPLPDGGARVVFDEPVRAITPGQAAVFYDGDTVLGGGTIVSVPAGSEETQK